MKSKIIAIIPARGGSKGINRKNLRLLGTHPLIFYSIKNALNSKHITDVVVTSEDEDILRYASRFPIFTRTRPSNLSEDSTPLDPVIMDALEYIEKSEKKYDIVITLQPTSPLLSRDTLDTAIEDFIKEGWDTVISACDSTRLGWRMEKGIWKKNYNERLNRQWLPRTARETGAFVISKRKILEKGIRIGKRVNIYEVPETESIDVDKPLDWFLCKALINRMKIYFIVSGNNEIGMGHINRTLTLADYWVGNDVKFLLWNTSSAGKIAIESRGFETFTLKSLNDVTNNVVPNSLIINDILDTETSYIDTIAKENFVVNFEDLGEGANQANLVFNALYEMVNPPPNHMFGYKFEFLSENFLLTEPNGFNKKVKTLMITFGGADPSNLTLRTLRALEKLDKKIKVKVIVGPAYKWNRNLEGYVRKLSKYQCIEYYSNVKNMAELMRGIDLAITSNGRTVYELAAMGIPMISIAQNDRETLHLFARYSKGVEYLGISTNVDDTTITDKIDNIIHDWKKRELMWKNLPFNELRIGIENVTGIIEKKYNIWRRNKTISTT